MAISGVDSVWKIYLRVRYLLLWCSFMGNLHVQHATLLWVYQPGSFEIHSKGTLIVGAGKKYFERFNELVQFC